MNNEQIKAILEAINEAPHLTKYILGQFPENIQNEVRRILKEGK